MGLGRVRVRARARARVRVRVRVRVGGVERDLKDLGQLEGSPEDLLEGRRGLGQGLLLAVDLGQPRVLDEEAQPRAHLSWCVGLE